MSKAVSKKSGVIEEQRRVIDEMSEKLDKALQDLRESNRQRDEAKAQYQACLSVPDYRQEVEQMKARLAANEKAMLEYEAKKAALDVQEQRFNERVKLVEMRSALAVSFLSGASDQLVRVALLTAADPAQDRMEETVAAFSKALGVPLTLLPAEEE